MDRLERVTLQALSKLEVLTEEELVAFVADREELIDAIKACQPIPGDEATYRERVDRILQYDAIIVQKMEWFRQQSDIEIHKIQNAKKQKLAYDAGYTMDSVLFDKRK